MRGLQSRGKLRADGERCADTGGPGSAPRAYAVPRRVRVWAAFVGAVVLALAVQSAFPGHRFLPDWSAAVSDHAVLAIFVGALACEYIDSALGMGYGTTLTPLLLLAGFAPLQIVPAILFSECCTGFAAGLLHQRDGNVDLIRDRRALGTMLLLSALSVAGVAAAVSLALSVPQFWLRAIIATIILSVGFVILATIRRQFRYRARHILVLGAVASFNKALSGGGYGPLVTGGQIVSGMTAKQAVAVTSFAEALTCVAGLGAYMLMSGSIAWELALPLTVGALASVPLATLTVKHIRESQMRGAIGVCTCLLGVTMVVKLIW